MLRLQWGSKCDVLSGYMHVHSTKASKSQTELVMTTAVYMAGLVFILCMINSRSGSSSVDEKTQQPLSPQTHIIYVNSNLKQYDFFLM